MTPTNIRSAMDRLREAAGAPPLPKYEEREVKHEVLKHTVVTRVPYLWFGLLVGLVAGFAAGYFLR